MPQPTLRQLLFFKTLSRTKNFSRAASQCGVSQPSLSGGITALEKILNCRLFDRSTRAVSITPTGAKLLPIAEANLSRWEFGLANLVNAAKGEPMIIHIAAITSMTSEILPAAVTLFRKNNPGIDISISDGRGPEVQNDVVSGRCDLGICLAPVEHENLEGYRFASDSLSVVCRKTHPLAKKTELCWAEIFEHSMISFASPSWISRNIQSVFEQHSVPYKPISTVRYEASLIGMLRDGEYFTILPSILAQVGVSENFRIIPLREPTVERQYILIRQRQEIYDPLQNDFFDFLVGTLTKLSRERGGAA